MKNVSSRYELICGQAVHFHKFIVMFSSNTSAHDRMEVFQTLQVNEVH